MAVRRIHGGLGNQEGQTVPFTSPWGQALLQNLGQLFAQPAPIGSQSGDAFGASVGYFAQRSASVKTQQRSALAYWGDAPQHLQADVEAADPWERP